MNRSCPSCGAPHYGTFFCVVCQRPLPRIAVPMVPTTGTKKMDVMEDSPAVRAGFFRRLAAFGLDWLTLSIIADILRLAYRFGSKAGAGEMHPEVMMGFSTFLFILYFTLTTGEGGQTLGKMILGIKVQRTDGSEVSYVRALARTLSYAVSFFFTTFLGFLWVLWDRKKQGWHDKIAGTEVIRV